MAECGEELDVAVGQLEGTARFAPVHGLRLLLIGLQEAYAEQEFTFSDKLLLGLLLTHSPQNTININAQ